jgi:hypothetical protein
MQSLSLPSPRKGAATTQKCLKNCRPLGESNQKTIKNDNQTIKVSCSKKIMKRTIIAPEELIQ